MAYKKKGKSPKKPAPKKAAPKKKVVKKKEEKKESKSRKRRKKVEAPKPREIKKGDYLLDSKCNRVFIYEPDRDSNVVLQNPHRFTFSDKDHKEALKNKA